MPKPTVCACLIVRNEETTLPRLAASLTGLVDYWVVVDTGSSDRTRDAVQRGFRDVPGELHDRPWVNFGHNRSELMSLAQDKADWLLLLDADMIVEGQLRTEELDPAVDSYLLEHAGDPSYWIPRLVRGDRSWHFVGVTHEYLATADGAPHARLKLAGLTIRHFADGGSRADKYERDRALLEAEVAKNPGDARSWFYLGRTYSDCGLPELAAEAFRRRVELGGWAEETYYAQFEIGNARYRSGDIDGAVMAWLSAWQLRPERLEALHAVVRQFRIQGLYQAAMALAEPVLHARPPADDILFVQSGIWDFELPLEHSICAYYVRGPKACLTETEALLALPGVPDAVLDFASQNADLCRRELNLVST